MPSIAIVTGASSGLGREFVKRIDAGEAGAVDEIWVVARRAQRLDALVRTCSTPVRPFCLDLCDEASFAMLEGALTETPGATVSLLINCAGAGTFGSFADQPKGKAGNMINLLAKAPVEMMYRTLPYMAPGSRIINIASVAAFTPQPKLAVYSAAKRFILDITRSLDAELREVGIHACAVCPKFMATEFLSNPGDSAAAQSMCAIGFEKPETVATKALQASSAGKSLCIPSLDMKAYYAINGVLPYEAKLKVERLLGIK